MSWQQWILAITLALNMILVPTQVGKPRQPITGGLAAFSIVVNIILIALVISI